MIYIVIGLFVGVSFGMFGFKWFNIIKNYYQYKEVAKKEINLNFDIDDI